MSRSPHTIFNQDEPADDVAAAEEKKPDPVVAAVEDKQEVSSEEECVLHLPVNPAHICTGACTLDFDVTVSRILPMISHSSY